MRGDHSQATTPAGLLTDHHGLFPILMSVVSARIEGNRTTAFEALDGGARTPKADAQSESIREIGNILRAMSFIDSLDPSEPISHVLVRELHRLSVEGLEREGDPTPGRYRQVDVEITKSEHRPPSHPYVHSEMSDWLLFVNESLPTSRQSAVSTRT